MWSQSTDQIVLISLRSKIKNIIKKRQHTEQPCGCYVNEASCMSNGKHSEIGKVHSKKSKNKKGLLHGVMDDHNQHRLESTATISKCYDSNANPAFLTASSWKQTKGRVSEHFGVFALKTISTGSLWGFFPHSNSLKPTVCALIKLRQKSSKMRRIHFKRWCLEPVEGSAGKPGRVAV